MGAPYVIDFVADCGADPTGTNNCAPALTSAVSKALAHKTSPAYAAANDFTLYVPPGVYKFTTTIGGQNMQSISTFRIVGHRAASIFLLASGDTSTALMGFSNQLNFEMDGITFVGNGTTNTPDVAAIVNVNSTYQTRISNCLINSVVATYYGIYSESGAAVKFENCLSFNSACQDATGGLWLASDSRRVTFEDCTFVDNSQINGDNGPGGGVNRLGTHKNTICIRGTVKHVDFRGLFVDEGCITGIRLGDGTSQIGTIDIAGLFINAPVFVGGNASVHIQKARSVRVHGSEHHTASAVPMFKLEAVDRADICNVIKSGGASPYIITADADCGWLRVADPVGFTASDIDADAAIPTKFIDELGTETSL